jgi:hypothetical protein
MRPLLRQGIHELTVSAHAAQQFFSANSRKFPRDLEGLGFGLLSSCLYWFLSRSLVLRVLAQHSQLTTVAAASGPMT